MSYKNTISITEARKRIFDIAEKVQNPSVHYTLTQRGRPKVVMMSAEKFDSWKETMEVMRECPDLAQEAKEAEEDYKSGDYKRYTTLDEILKKEGLIVTENKAKKYGLSNKPKIKSRKRIKKDTKK